MAEVISYSSMFNYSAPFQRIARMNPDMSQQEIIQEYRRYLKSISLVDPTPINDVVGWLVRRMTGVRTLDAIVAVYGDRGNGKSYVCGYLGERIDIRLAHLMNMPEKSYFSIDNVRSVDKSGSLEMLTPKKMREKPNQVFILDDASIATNSRNFQSEYNKNLNAILTTARIYRHCIILNTVASNMIDSVARSFADIGILVKGLIPGTTINECRVFRMSQTNHMGFGKGAKESMGKYFQLTVNGEQNRMTRWYTGKPSGEWCFAYDALRKENTDKLGDTDEESEGSKTGKRLTKPEKKREDMIKKYYAPTMERYLTQCDTGKPNISAIAREVGISREWVNVMLAESKRKGIQ